MADDNKLVWVLGAIIVGGAGYMGAHVFSNLADVSALRADTDNLVKRTDGFGDRTNDIAKRTEAINTELAKRTEAMNTALDERTALMTTELNERTRLLRGGLFDLNESVGASVGSLELRTDAIMTVMDERTAAIRESMGASVHELEQRTEAIAQEGIKSRKQLYDRFDRTQRVLVLVLQALADKNDDLAKTYLKLLAMGELPEIAVVQTASPDSITLFSAGADTEGVDFRDYLNLYADTDFATIRDPQWHPSQPRLLFSGRLADDPSEDNYELFIYDFLLRDLRRLTRNDKTDVHAKWSVDGKEIVFVRLNDDDPPQGVAWRRSVPGPCDASDDTTTEVEGANLFWVAGGEEADAYGGNFHDAYFPTFTLFEPWVMVTAKTEGGDYHLWMVNTSTNERYELFPERTTSQCKGNWGKFDGQSFIVFNESREPEDFASQIIRAQIKYDDTRSGNPFSTILITLVDDDAANMAPDFLGDVNAVVFSSKRTKAEDDHYTLKTVHAFPGGEPMLLRASASHSFEYPDWRARITIDGLMDYSSE